MKRAATSSNKVNLKLLHAYRNAQQQGNAFYSPFSITSALAMLCEGAKSSTKKEIENILGIEEVDSIREGFHLFSKSFQELSDSIILNITNVLAVDQNYELLPDFTDNLKENYNTDSKLFDFQSHPEAAREDLNQLIESATHKMIRDLFTSDSVSSDTRLVLANAIYFKGTWDEPFCKYETTKKPFYTSVNKKIMVDMMFKSYYYKYFHSEELNACFLEVPYLGNKLSIVVVLPKEIDGLLFVEKNITLENLNYAIENMSVEDEVFLYFPRFKLEESLPLKECLLSLGMKKGFNSGEANFSGISGRRNLFISAALHKAFVEVNEEGTTAAAATGLGVTPCCARPFINFIVDHPFMFFIREIESGLILFTGSVLSL